MEGDGPTGSAAIPEYLQMKNTLKKKLDLSNRNNPLHPMFVKMFEKTNTYLVEALACETLVISTILNPSFRLAIFEKHWMQRKGSWNCLKKERTKWRKRSVKRIRL